MRGFGRGEMDEGDRLAGSAGDGNWEGVEKSQEDTLAQTREWPTRAARGGGCPQISGCAGADGGGGAGCGGRRACHRRKTAQKPCAAGEKVATAIALTQPLPHQC